MRPMIVIGGSIAALAITGILLWTKLAPAQGPLTAQPAVPGEIMKIVLPNGVEVRSGPSASFYATSNLKYGDSVKVLPKTSKDNPGWLAIEPPPGSQSWINATFVQRTKDNQGVVVCSDDAPVPVKPASLVYDGEPKVESTKLARGTLLVILGPEKVGTDGAWYPILPPTGDVRYIPESAVGRNSAAQTVNVTPASGFVPGPSGDQSALAEGDKALYNAKQYYKQAANSTDPNMAAQARYKLQALEQIQIAQAATQPGFPAAAPPPPSRVALGGNVGTVPVSASNTAVSASPSQTGPAQWTKWGYLRKTPITNNGQPMYRLEDSRGTPLGYAMAAPGLSLEMYIGKLATLYGPTAYRSDDNSMRNNYTIVSNISLQPAN